MFSFCLLIWRFLFVVVVVCIANNVVVGFLLLEPNELHRMLCSRVLFALSCFALFHRVGIFVLNSITIPFFHIQGGENNFQDIWYSCFRFVTRLG